MQHSYLSETVVVKTVSEDDKKGIFEIRGLYPGFGLTVGNSFRRVLLSSISGAAITHFKVKGALHEFSSIDGVIEDLIEIGLNLKKIRFKFYADEPQILILRVKGEKEVTAADIAGNAQVTVVNPNQRLFAITDKKTEVVMELTVEKGRGYMPVERMKKDKLEVGVIAIDAMFTPVQDVGVTVENMRVGDRTDYNLIRLSIETDGSIRPSAALHKASNVLIDHFKKVSLVTESADEVEIKKDKKDKEKEKEVKKEKSSKESKLEEKKKEIKSKKKK